MACKGTYLPNTTPCKVDKVISVKRRYECRRGICVQAKPHKHRGMQRWLWCSKCYFMKSTTIGISIAVVISSRALNGHVLGQCARAPRMRWHKPAVTGLASMFITVLGVVTSDG